MLGKLIAGAVTSAIAVFVLYRSLTPFRPVWVGAARVVRTLPTRLGVVEARTYLAYLLWVVPGSTGLLLVGVAVLLHELAPGANALGRGAAMVGLALFLAAWPLTLPQVMVNATNRPRFLVPPPYRNRPGAVAIVRQRRAQERDGRRPTEHVVEMLEVPRDHGGPPLLIAACSVPECDWYADADPALDHAEAANELRSKAREHTANIAEQVTGPLG